MLILLITLARLGQGLAAYQALGSVAYQAQADTRGQTPLSSCKPGWQDWGGRCFYISTGTKNWWDAKQDCIRRGGRLFEPRSKELNELVYSNVPGPAKCYWVGISDIEAENKYVYASDDKELTYTNFRPGYPISNSTKNCFLYACDGSHPFKFWDYGCEVSIAYVCEELTANSNCGLLDTILVEESFKTADVSLCRAICMSMSSCSHYTWAPASLACGLRTTPAGGMVDLPNIETGSPYMSGTVRDKIFVSQVARRRTAKECQEWCQGVAECRSWSWSSPSHSTPLACSLHYGEPRARLALPGAGLVSGPRCCGEPC